MPNGLPVWCPIPIDKDMLNNMKYDGGAIQRNKRIKNFLPIFYDSVITAASQSKTRYTYTGKEFFSDIFTLEDTKVSQDLVPILTFLFPNCSVFYSETKNFCGKSVGKTISVDWS